MFQILKTDCDESWHGFWDLSVVKRVRTYRRQCTRIKKSNLSSPAYLDDLEDHSLGALDALGLAADGDLTGLLEGALGLADLGIVIGSMCGWLW